MKHEFEFKKTFVIDYNSIIESLSEHALKRFSAKLSSKIKQIIAFPESCPRLKESHYFESGIRWVPILEKYILIYLFEKEKISFLRLL
ncbi:hypothetical protein L0Z72_08955, partial [candidate division KSB1 bacterium]|nr:hypothetical protein [candidate division KSB1 bacterium]